MHITLGIIAVVQVGMLIALYRNNRRLTGMQRQINGLQERYNEEDYEAFWESLREESEKMERESAQEFIGPVPYEYKTYVFADDKVMEEGITYPSLKYIGR